jgi:hypothetical protein
MADKIRVKTINVCIFLVIVFFRLLHINLSFLSPPLKFRCIANYCYPGMTRASRQKQSKIFFNQSS